MSNSVQTPQTTETKKEKVDVMAKVKAGFENIAKNFSKDERKKLLRLVILLVAVLFVTNPGMIPFLPQDIKNTLTNTITGMFGNVTGVSGMIALDWVVLFKLVVMVIVMQIANIVCGSLLEAVNPKSNRGKTIKHLLLSGFNYMVGIVGIFWALSILGVDLATLFASLGILALIVGFGAESLIADMVTGLFMIFENEYNVGDIIELSGYRGTVTSIGIRTTCVTDAGGNVKVFNNSDMRNIVNLSSMGSIAVCDFAIPYEVKIADAEKALEKVLAEVQAANPEVFTEMPQYKGVQLLGESAVTLRVTANVAESDRFTAARLLNRGLKEGMERMGISCPYNQIVVHRAD